MNIGIIGAGTIGEKHAAAANKAGARVRWIVDLDPQRAERLAQQCDAKSAASPTELWADPAVDAIVVGTPNRWHAEHAIQSLSAGKDVLLEKPMALSAAECREINAATHAHRRVLQVGYAHRYTAVGALAKELVAAGRCGTIYHSYARLSLRRGVPGLGKWFTNRACAGGGALIDVGVHLIDLALFVTGFPRVVDVVGQTYAVFGRRMRNYVYESMWAGPPDYDGVCDVEDSATAMIRMENGATLQLEVAWAGNFPAATTAPSAVGFLGDEGGIAFELFGDHVHWTGERDGAVVDERIAAPDKDFYGDQFVDFMEAVATRTVRGATGEQAEQVQSIVDAIYQSTRGGDFSPPARR